MKVFLIILVVILVIAVVSVIYPLISRRLPESKVSGSFLSKSEDGGETWHNMVFPGGEVTVMRFDAENPDYLFVGTARRGLWRGKRSGEEWKQYPISLGEGSKIFDIVEPAAENGLDALVFYSGRGRIIRMQGEGREELLFAPAERYAFFQGIKTPDKKIFRVIGSDGGLYETRDGGESWEVVSRFQEGLSHIEPNTSRPLQMWVLDTKGNLYRSDNGGRAWVDLNAGLREFRSTQGQRTLHFDANSKILYHASSFGLLASTDLGKTWELVNIPIPPQLVPITVVATDLRNSKKIFAGVGSELYISENRGITWKIARINSAGAISKILIDPKNPNNVFIGLAGTSQTR